MAQTAVSAPALCAMVFTLLVCFLLPIGLWIAFARREKGFSLAVLAGIVGFVVPQLFIRLPIIQGLSLVPAWRTFIQQHFILYCALLALTAGLFETAGRLFVFKVMLRKRLSFYTGLGAGIGHGGSEAILLIGMTYVNNIILSILLNTGALSSISGTEIGDALAPSLQALTSVGAVDFLAAGVERSLTIAFHIALSVLLCWFIMKGRTWTGALLCVAVHGASDFCIPLISHYTGSIWLSEAALAVVAAGSILVVVLLSQRFPPRAAAVSEPAVSPEPPAQT